MVWSCSLESLCVCALHFVCYLATRVANYFWIASPSCWLSLPREGCIKFLLGHFSFIELGFSSTSSHWSHSFTDWTKTSPLLDWITQKTRTFNPYKWLSSQPRTCSLNHPFNHCLHHFVIHSKTGLTHPLMNATINQSVTSPPPVGLPIPTAFSSFCPTLVWTLPLPLL